ncbi:hypothetical protein MGG_00601 [Pyricularia oryzae 70-15]|uniref:adenosine deaminase n=1 Tax=Pyricularia oryzae (strain 70-15 / ATCC MYA-4617 / FGSC 8958) TaxID=242507 RepID=G4NB92_PYRO7|nr:uncharacterized protein MGG_00601 [Pyricularia oryzae 70-15]EHA48854.1 hypothetical protein MGG_00601 [Pyricularia oryzae 70-15]KAI7921018.1 hypothetical protein M0657_006276 [Pyricularia oryzae]KAI7926599.1 hypothetical protein M9X92_002613 [Pyricularia oryzae]
MLLCAEAPWELDQTKHSRYIRSVVRRMTASSGASMGNNCTSVDKEESEGDARIPTPQSPTSAKVSLPLRKSRSGILTRAQSKLVKRTAARQEENFQPGAFSPPNLKRKIDTAMDSSSSLEQGANWSTLSALDEAVQQRRRQTAATSQGQPSKQHLRRTSIPPLFKSDGSGLSEYENARAELKSREHALAFDYECFADATGPEREANKVLQRLRRKDAKLFADASKTRGFSGQMHARHVGDHFLHNVDLINQSAIYKVARRMPKGTHLHIHFNSCLDPKFLLDLAKDQERMFIHSNRPLLQKSDLDLCEIQFSIVPLNDEEPGWNVFEPGYVGGKWMPYTTFRAQFPGTGLIESSVDEWLLNKLVFGAEETYGIHQTVKGAWEKFNGRTRMMKGLFNYETAFKSYTRACLQDFVDDNIQYAEIRPNFMHTNQVFHDDGSAKYDNTSIMQMIEEVCNEFMPPAHQNGRKVYFKGIKVIYCTPRIFKREQVENALEECIKFKKRWSNLIAGFDLVGEEAAGNPLKYFVPEFLKFREQCKKEELDIPFLFHCGETLDMGDDTPDGNLTDALLLNSKRIGHGFSLARHPYIMEQMKKRNICLELCPISNEVLGLTPRVKGHAMYNLLANNVHCTLNSDNGTLFKSSLSHDFYQMFVGRSDTTIHGWKQLIKWSIEHACLTDDERIEVTKHWEELWVDFVHWLIEEYKDLEADVDQAE